MPNVNELLYADKVKSDPAFLNKVVEVAQRLKMSPHWLMYVMNNESGLNPAAYNPNGGATGLIQFMPATAKGLGTSTDALRKMNRVQQMEYVYKYFAPFKGRFKTIFDVYCYNFYQVAVGKPMSYVFGSESKNPNYAKVVGKANPGFDLNKDQIITMAEFVKYNYDKIKKQGLEKYLLENVDPNLFKMADTLSTALDLPMPLIVGIGLVLMNKK